jgi:hypothetical protein
MREGALLPHSSMPSASLELLVFWSCWSLELLVGRGCLSFDFRDCWLMREGALLPHSSMPSASLELHG